MGSKSALQKMLGRLAKGEIVVLKAQRWMELAGGFEVLESVDTGLAGEIQLLTWEDQDSGRSRWGILEQPRPEEKVVRPLAGENEARALIADRLAAYERMWDG